MARAMTDGLAVLAAWAELVTLLALLTWLVLHRRPDDTGPR